MEGAERFRSSRRVKLLSLRAVLLKDVHKQRMYQELPLYLLWVFALTLSITVSGVANLSGYNGLYHLERGHHTELDMEEFDRIKHTTEFWAWCNGLTQRLWLRDVPPSNLPLGFLLLRQYRVALQRAPDPPKAITPHFRSLLPHTAAPDWSADVASAEPYGPGGEWRPSRAMPHPIDVAAVSTAYHSFTDPGMAFPVVLRYMQPEEEVAQRVAALERDGWIDNATRVVIVDVLTYNAGMGSFAINHMYAEMFASGSIVMGARAYPFRLRTLGSTRDRFLFALDVIVLVGYFCVLVSTVRGIRLNRELEQCAVGAWEVLELLCLVIIAVAYYYRMWLWSEGQALQDTDAAGDGAEAEVQMFTALFAYGYRFQRGQTLLAVVVLLAWLRLLRSLQHNKRLSALSQTLRRAAGELFSLLIIFSVVLTGYALSGAALFGSDFQEFNSLSRSFGYLVQILVSAELGPDWQELRQIQPEAAWLYFISFFVLCWLILLNMVLAIVTGSFAAVQSESGRVADWNPRKVWRDSRRECKRLWRGRGKSTDASHVSQISGKMSKLLVSYKVVTQLISTYGSAHSVTLADWMDLSAGIWRNKHTAKIWLRCLAKDAAESDGESTDQDESMRAPGSPLSPITREGMPRQTESVGLRAAHSRGADLCSHGRGGGAPLTPLLLTPQCPTTDECGQFGPTTAPSAVYRPLRETSPPRSPAKEYCGDATGTGDVSCISVLTVRPSPPQGRSQREPTAPPRARRHNSLSESSAVRARSTPGSGEADGLSAAPDVYPL